MSDDLVAIAKIAKTRGLRGELVADVLTDFPERFNDLENIYAVGENGERTELKLEKFWYQNGRIILKFVDFNTIEAAETLRGREICIPESEAVELDKDEFFDWQLEDCAVETVEGEEIGRVTKVMRTGGTEILVVKNGEKEYLIPFAEAICPEVDVENKLIKVDAPEGLLEF